MTKSEILKAAHALAKGAQKKMGGDYAVYLSLYMSKVFADSKKIAKEAIFSAVNRATAKFGFNPVFLKRTEQKQTHGLIECERGYQLDKEEKNLKSGRFLGKRFTKNGNVCAWVRSVKTVLVAY